MYSFDNNIAVSAKSIHLLQSNFIYKPFIESLRYDTATLKGTPFTNVKRRALDANK